MPAYERQGTGHVPLATSQNLGASRQLCEELDQNPKVSFCLTLTVVLMEELKILTLISNNTSSLAGQILKSPWTDLSSEAKSVQGTPLC